MRKTLDAEQEPDQRHNPEQRIDHERDRGDSRTGFRSEDREFHLPYFGSVQHQN